MRERFIPFFARYILQNGASSSATGPVQNQPPPLILRNSTLIVGKIIERGV